ncbi:hypothetical protein GW17_00010554 [Ensete ventricosum]|nr:hypothetical protein GW17_00010554 [Ensete ventricosum]
MMLKLPSSVIVNHRRSTSTSQDATALLFVHDVTQTPNRHLPSYPITNQTNYELAESTIPHRRGKCVGRHHTYRSHDTAACVCRWQSRPVPGSFAAVAHRSHVSIGHWPGNTDHADEPEPAASLPLVLYLAGTKPSLATRNDSKEVHAQGGMTHRFFPAMTKIVGTLGPKSRSVEVISACLKAGMSGMPHVLASPASRYWAVFWLAISTWGVRNKIDFLSLSYTRHAEDVRQVFLFQKAAVYKCNMAGKPAVITRVVDSMTDNLRPTRAEATDAEKVFNQDLYFKKTVKYVGEPMTHLESIASSAAESTSNSNESVLKVALDHGKASGLIKSHDRVVVCQKVGDASVVKIIELED